MSKSFRQTAVEELYRAPNSILFVQSVYMAQYSNQLANLPFFTASMFPGMIGMLRQTLLPGFVLSAISPTTFDVVVPLFNSIGRIRVTLANVDRYAGYFSKAFAHAKGRMGFDPVNDQLRWVSVKILTEEKLPDIIGTIVTIEGIDLGREMVDLMLMERYDPSRQATCMPHMPLVQGIYAHEAEYKGDSSAAVEIRAKRGSSARKGSYPMKT